MKNKRMIHLFNAVLILGTLLFLASCKPTTNEVQVGKDANGQPVTVKIDQVLAVHLESNPTTGYSWEMVGVDPSILKQDGEPVYEAAAQSKPVVGGGGWQTFHLKPQKAGTTQVQLVYRRPWEKDVKPIETFDLQVTVQ